MAKRQGLELQKIRRRDPRAVDFGNYWLVDPYLNTIVLGDRWGASIDEVEEWLTSDERLR